MQVLCCLIKYSSAYSFRYKNINTMVIERKGFLENETRVNILLWLNSPDTKKPYLVDITYMGLSQGNFLMIGTI